MAPDISRVISFRLSPDDPIEGRALAFLEEQEAKRGKRKTRQIIAEALAAAGDRVEAADVTDLRRGQAEILNLLKQIEAGGVKLVSQSGEETAPDVDLTEQFKGSLLRLQRPMRRLEDE